MTDSDADDLEATHPLSPNAVDRRVSLYKSIAGTLPFIAPIVQEIISAVIPNQRMDRIAALLEALEARIGPLEAERVQARAVEPKMVDLIEDGFFAAARSLSEEKIAYIAEILAKGFSAEELDHTRLKAVMRIVEQLDAADVLVLLSYTVAKQRDRTWLQEHRAVLFEEPAHLRSPPEAHEKQTLHRQQRGRLRQIDLLKPNFKKPSKGNMPEFDTDTGMLKAGGMKLTPLGRLVLRVIDPDGVGNEASDQHYM